MRYAVAALFVLFLAGCGSLTTGKPKAAPADSTLAPPDTAGWYDGP